MYFRIVMRSVVVSTIILSSSALAEASVMPGELIEYATERGCSQIVEFYEDRYAATNPPFVYGYLSAAGDDRNHYWDNAVFWCKTSEGGKNRYYLLFMFKYLGHSLTKCPDRIEWDTPGGLSIFRDKKTSVKGFRHVNDPSKKSPVALKLTHNAIISEDEGGVDLFYCHEGEWLVKRRSDP